MYFSKSRICIKIQELPNISLDFFYVCIIVPCGIQCWIKYAKQLSFNQYQSNPRYRHESLLFINLP